MTFEELLPLALLALVFFILIVRPMRARQKQFAALREMQNALQIGSRVMISSGIHGTIRELEEDTVGLEVSPGVVITVARAAVAEIEGPQA
ncbi:MAG: preprotein translocase subunit YajC [Chloroflexota bacterium]|uniref:preprotein translocase subunit YajC n=1 Tax=Aeromicrobium sp. TaxID=1871063 RepID=UPI0027C161BD|nr:preprotein translocase subunit YajC [Aeromicrobium sp.]MDQ2689360.1 preprotein translocase subunit YajC [Chloroflexota bacterium]